MYAAQQIVHVAKPIAAMIMLPSDDDDDIIFRFL